MTQWLLSDLRRALEAITHEGIVGLFVIGSVAQRLLAGRDNIGDCNDLDLLICVNGDPRSFDQACLAPLTQIGPTEVFLIDQANLNRRVFGGDVQFIAILSSAYCIHASPELRALQTDIASGAVRSGLEEVQRLLDEGVRVFAAGDDSPRTMRAAYLAGAQAVVLAAGEQPGATDALHDLVRELAAQNRAPSNSASVWDALWHSDAGARAALDGWLDLCTLFAFRNMADVHYPESNNGSIEAVVCDIGGTAIIDDHGTPAADVRSSLERLASSYRVFAVSNGTSEVRDLLKSAGIAQYFERILISAEIGRIKPDPRIFDSLFALGLSSSGMVMIGDQLTTDLCCAWKAGIRAIWYRPQIGRTRITMSQGALVGHWRDVPPVVDRMGHSR